MKEGVIYVNHGFDETNNGNYPMIYTRVGSDISEDIEERREKENFFPKPRRSHKSITDKLSIRDYSFLMLTNFESAKIAEYKKIGIVLASLVYGEPIGDTFRGYIDGEWSTKEIDFTMGILSDVTGLEKSAIEIITGKDLDKRIGLVNIADETAHWLMRKTLSSLRKNKNKKEILFKELKEFF